MSSITLAAKMILMFITSYGSAKDLTSILNLKLWLIGLNFRNTCLSDFPLSH